MYLYAYQEAEVRVYFFTLFQSSDAWSEVSPTAKVGTSGKHLALSTNNYANNPRYIYLGP